jgi:hypothetical protein
MTAACPHCHQPYAAERLGVRVTPLKARIIDAIKAAGDVGISSEVLHLQLYFDRNPASVRTIKAHVWQINDQLEQTHWVIESDRRRWYLRRRQGRKAA